MKINHNFQKFCVLIKMLRISIKKSVLLALRVNIVVLRKWTVWNSRLQKMPESDYKLKY